MSKVREKTIKETYSVRVSSKGQVVIPKIIREYMGITAGSVIDFDVFKNPVTEQIKGVQIDKDMSLIELAESEKFPLPRKNRGVDPVKARKYMEKHYEKR